MKNKLKYGAIAAIVILLICCFAFKYLRVSGPPQASGPVLYADSKFDIAVTGEEKSFRTMKENPLRITINDRSGEPIDAADIQVKLTMPGMFCGELIAEVVRTQSGDYVAKAIPVMDGKWQAKITVTTQDASASPVLMYTFNAA